jgi:hypothetical protein
LDVPESDDTAEARVSAGDGGIEGGGATGFHVSASGDIGGELAVVSQLDDSMRRSVEAYVDMEGARVHLVGGRLEGDDRVKMRASLDASRSWFAMARAVFQVVEPS